MHYCLSGIKTLTLKLQVPSKTWCEGQPFIRCLLCANENAEGFMCHSSVLLSTPSFNVEKKELQGYEQVLFCFQIFFLKWVLIAEENMLKAWITVQGSSEQLKVWYINGPTSVQMFFIVIKRRKSIILFLKIILALPVSAVLLNCSN